MGKVLRNGTKNQRRAEHGFIPAGQFKKLGIPNWIYVIYKLIAERPTASNKLLMRLSGQSETEVKQAIWRLRHWFKAIRPIRGHAICDLRLGDMARRRAETIKSIVPVEEWSLYFNEDGTRKFKRLNGDEITEESARAAFTTELISGEIVRYLLAGGLAEMPCWEYWDFAKKLGCDMSKIKRPNQELLENACKENERLRTTGRRLDIGTGDGSGQANPAIPGSEICSGEGNESCD